MVMTTVTDDFFKASSHFISPVKNHGIPQDYIDEVLKVIKEYYSLPADEKMKVRPSGLLRLTGESLVSAALLAPS